MTRPADLPALTSPRFVAAFGVFIFHAFQFLPGPGVPPFTEPLVHLSAAVSFFFVLSGFILAYNYLDSLRRPTLRGVWNFYVARWARVYPLHVLACLITVALNYKLLARGTWGEPVELVTGNLLLVQTYVPTRVIPGNSINPPAWSLVTECFSYLLLPLLIPGLTTGSRARRAAVLLLAFAPWLLTVAANLGAPVPALTPDPYCFPPVRFADFATGVLLGILWHGRAAGARAPSLARGTAAEFGAIASFAACECACLRVSPQLGWEAAGPRALYPVWMGVYLLPFAVMVWVLARGGGPFARLFSLRPLVYLGEISFSFYMLHIPVVFLFWKKGHWVKWHLWSWEWRWAAVAAVTLLASVACYHLYEIPMRNRLKRWLSVRRAAPLATPAGQLPDAPPVPESPRRAA
jgi:peptidoglycan/LPS O-acetylase OafA/YrhL